MKVLYFITVECQLTSVDFSTASLVIYMCFVVLFSFREFAIMLFYLNLLPFFRAHYIFWQTLVGECLCHANVNQNILCTSD